MYKYNSTPLEHYQFRLRKWIANRPKLITGIIAGQSDEVLKVSAQNGIVVDLTCFSERFLEKYYTKQLFIANTEQLITQLAKALSTAVTEIKERDLNISITVKLHSQQVKKDIKIEAGMLYMTI